MRKSIATSEYRIFVGVLRQLRLDAGVTQVELAGRIDETQSFVSKVERGELRLDIIQLRTICLALGSDLATLVSRLESGLTPKTATGKTARTAKKR